MKKHIQKIFLLLFLSVMQTGNAQSVPLSPPGRGTMIDNNCYGSSGSCSASMSVLTSRSADNSTPTFSLYKNQSNNIVIEYPKSLIDEDTKSEFANRNAYFLEKEQILNESIQIALQTAKPIVLARGWHPIIELADRYVISYTLKEENK